MNVQMKNALPRFRIGINHGPKAGSFNSLLLCRASHDSQQMTEKLPFILQIIIQGSNVFSRDHQQVNRSLWMNIVKDYTTFIFMNNGCRRFVCSNPAENAIGHYRQSLSRPLQPYVKSSKHLYH